MKQFLVIYGSCVEIVESENADFARSKWMLAHYPPNDGFGRVMPPMPFEITVREATEKDLEDLREMGVGGKVSRPAPRYRPRGF